MKDKKFQILERLKAFSKITIKHTLINNSLKKILIRKTLPIKIFQIESKKLYPNDTYNVIVWNDAILTQTLLHVHNYKTLDIHIS